MKRLFKLLPLQYAQLVLGIHLWIKGIIAFFLIRNRLEIRLLTQQIHFPPIFFPWMSSCVESIPTFFARIITLFKTIGLALSIALDLWMKCLGIKKYPLQFIGTVENHLYEYYRFRKSEWRSDRDTNSSISSTFGWIYETLYFCIFVLWILRNRKRLE